MKSNIICIVSLVFLILFLAGCEKKPEQQTQQATPFPTVKVSLRTVTSYKSYPASVEGTINSEIRAKVPGYVKKVLVDEGQSVKKGQLLFQIETQSLTQDAQAAKSRIDAAQVEVNKITPLVEKNIIGNAQLETAKANLAQARSNYQSVLANIDYANIRSAVDGVVGRINYREGNLVSPADPTPLAIVSDVEEVYVFFSMNEKEYLNFLQTTEGNTLSEKIKNFPKVKFELANGAIFENEGVIETVTGQVNQATGTVSFRAIFENNGLLTNGNSGKILIPQIYENAKIIPEVATFEQQGQIFVFKVSEENIAVKTIIEPEDRVENLVIVKSGLNEGDEIVAKGATKLSNNTPITPQPVSLDSIVNSLNTVFKN